jgi:hypothetical protein
MAEKRTSGQSSFSDSESHERRKGGEYTDIRKSQRNTPTVYQHKSATAKINTDCTDPLDRLPLHIPGAVMLLQSVVS